VGIPERRPTFLVAVSRPVQARKPHSRRPQGYHILSLSTDRGRLEVRNWKFEKPPKGEAALVREVLRLFSQRFRESEHLAEVVRVK
jgi:hypothetical protein